MNKSDISDDQLLVLAILYVNGGEMHEKDIEKEFDAAIAHYGSIAEAKDAYLGLAKVMKDRQN